MFRTKLKTTNELVWAKELVYNLSLALFVALIIIVALVNILNIRLDQVLSDSMYPAFNQKDIIVVMKQKDYEVGDVIEFRQGDKNVAHRLVDITSEGIYVAKGDFEGGSTQNVKKEEIHGKVVAVWKNGRTTYNLIKNNYVLIFTIIIGAWVLSVTISGEKELRSHNILKV